MSVGGLSCAGVALLTGISPRLAVHLVHGRGGRPLRRISPETARQLLRVTSAEAQAVRRRLVPAGVTTQRLRRLRASGWSESELAGLLGLPLTDVTALVDGTQTLCSQLTALRAGSEVTLIRGARVATASGVRAAA
jgi:plasmid maintenance system antidote protein VapI